MRSWMTTLQQPLSMAVLAQCLGWATGRQPPAAAGRLQRRQHRHSRTRVAGPLLAAEHGALAVAPDDEADDLPEGGRCGWFDSSHELHQGLVVLEHAGAQGLGAELPLTEWLRFVLEGVPQPLDGKPQAGTQGIITP